MEEQKNFTNMKIAVIVHIQINAKKEHTSRRNLRNYKWNRQCKSIRRRGLKSVILFILI